MPGIRRASLQPLQPMEGSGARQQMLWHRFFVPLESEKGLRMQRLPKYRSRWQSGWQRLAGRVVGRVHSGRRQARRRLRALADVLVARVFLVYRDQMQKTAHSQGCLLRHALLRHCNQVLSQRRSRDLLGNWAPSARHVIVLPGSVKSSSEKHGQIILASRLEHSVLY